VVWAYRNLGNPDANPPNRQATALLALGRDYPDRLVACMALADPPHAKADARGPAADGPAKPCTGGAAVGSPGAAASRRLQEVAVAEKRLLSHLSEGTGYVFRPPHDAHVVGCQLDTAKREIRLIFHSESFPVVAEGEPIPDMEREYVPDQY
jgi:hypothetical protein